jgi:hypothetical protein
MNLLTQQKRVGAITLLSGLLAFASMVAVFIAVNYNADALSDPLLVLSTKGVNTTAARWSMILDMFGYYLLLLPVVYLLHDWFRERSVWAGMMRSCAVAYVLIGSIGASILAVVWPRIIDAFPLAGDTEQQILKANFMLVNDIVYNAMWNLLEMTFAATWWAFTGYQLLKYKHRFVGWLSVITAVSCVGDAVSGMLQAGWLHEVSLNVYLLFAIVWAIAIGIFLMKGRLNGGRI